MPAVTNAKTSDPVILLKRKRLILAIQQGMMDSALAADHTTAYSNGFKDNTLGADSPVDTSPIGGVNS